MDGADFLFSPRLERDARGRGDGEGARGPVAACWDGCTGLVTRVPASGGEVRCRDGLPCEGGFGAAMTPVI